MTAATEWRIVIDWMGRPHTSNDERRKHWRALTGIHAGWRQAGLQAAQTQRIPKGLPACTVTAWGRYKTGSSLPDVGAIAPTVKCVIDGLTDHGCWPADTAEWVAAETLLPPMVDGSQPDALVLVLRPVVDAEVTR